MVVDLLHSLTLGAIGITWLCGWRVGRRWCRDGGVRERTSRWALACVVPTTGLVLAVHLLGYAAMFAERGLVTPEPVAIVFALLMWLAHRLVSASKRSSPPEHEDLVEPKTSAWPGTRWLPVLVLVGLYSVFFVEALTRYPTGYDGLYYHLPVAIGWMQQRALNLVPGMLYQSLPGNGMIVPFLLSFAGNEKLLIISQLPNGLLVAAVIYGLSRAVGVSRLGGLAAVCVAASIPMVVFQSFSSYIDLYGAASWLSALLALTWATRATDGAARRGLLLLAGLSAGVALGSKSTHFVLVAMLGLTAMAVEWIRPRATRVKLARPVRNLARFGLAALVCSSFWFVRGTVQGGNPVYPFAVKIAGTEILPGFATADHVPSRTLDRSFTEKMRSWRDYPWRETNFAGTSYPYGPINGIGAAYTAFVPLGMLAVLLSGLTRRPRDAIHKWRLTYLALALSGTILLCTIFIEVLRYVLPLILIGVPLGAVIMDRLINRCPRTMLVFLTLALGVTGIIAAVQPIRSFAGRLRDGRWDRPWFYQIPPLIEELEPGSRIVNLAPPEFTYPLLGAAFTNVVIPGPQWDRLLDGTPASADALIEHDIDYVFVRDPRRHDWLDGLATEKIFDDTHTRPLATTGVTRIYRVKSAHEVSEMSIAQRTDPYRRGTVRSREEAGLRIRGHRPANLERTNAQR